MALHEITVQPGSHWATALGHPIGSRITLRRTHAPYLHPTKGYRAMSVPRKTNRRRRPILALGMGMKGTAEYNKRNISGGRWPKLRGEIKRRFLAFVRRAQQPRAKAVA